MISKVIKVTEKTSETN